MSWIVYELTSWGEKENTPALEREIKKYLGKKVSIFVPALVKDDVDLSLVKGYVFVNIPDDIQENLLYRLENTRLVKLLLTENQVDRGRLTRRISVVEDNYIYTLKKKFSDVLKSNIKVNDIVRVRGGLYRNLEAKVLQTNDQYSSVLIELKTLKVIVDIPNFNLIRDI